MIPSNVLTTQDVRLTGLYGRILPGDFPLFEGHDDGDLPNLGQLTDREG